MNPWRQPAEETTDYPGLYVHDGRVSGSITFGQSRLPAWAITGELFNGEGWDGVELGWEPSQYGWDEQRFGDFIYNLLEMRGEFGRLLCVLADVERDEQERTNKKLEGQDSVVEISPWKPEGDGVVHLPPAWWEYEPSRSRVVKVLRRCLQMLEPDPIPEEEPPPYEEEEEDDPIATGAAFEHEYVDVSEEERQDFEDWRDHAAIEREWFG